MGPSLFIAIIILKYSLLEGLKQGTCVLGSVGIVRRFRGGAAAALMICL